jgi:predicted CopG family antitoxin
MLNNKTVTITEDAYNALIKEKRGDETLSETILRLTKPIKTDNRTGKKVVETENGRVPHTFGEGWFTSSDLL